MKKLSGVLVCLLLFTFISSARIIEVADAGITDKLRAVIAAKNAGGEAPPSTPDLFYDSFGTGSDEYDNTLPCGSAPCWTEDQGVGNTVDADYASGYAGDGLEINPVNTGNDATSTMTNSATTAVHYIQLRFKVLNWNASPTWGHSYISFHGHQESWPVSLKTYNDSASNFPVQFKENGGTEFEIAEIKDTNWHHLVYRCPSDSTTDITYKWDGGGEATATDVECDSDTVNFTLGARADGVTVAYQVIFDDFGICSEANKANCGW